MITGVVSDKMLDGFTPLDDFESTVLGVLEAGSFEASMLYKK